MPALPAFYEGGGGRSGGKHAGEGGKGEETLAVKAYLFSFPPTMSVNTRLSRTTNQGSARVLPCNCTLELFVSNLNDLARC